MRLIIILMIMIMVSVAQADQISYQESSRPSDTDNYHTSKDRRLQYNFGDEQYTFLQYRQTGVCPYYCGFNYDMYGLGVGRSYKSSFATIFVQAGYYIVDNSVGKTKNNENLYYYFNRRFASFDKPVNFEKYEVKNKNTFGVTIGADIPLNNWAGIKFSYQYMKLKENITGYFNEAETIYWHDPVNRDLSTISAGLYVNW